MAEKTPTFNLAGLLLEAAVLFCCAGFVALLLGCSAEDSLWWACVIGGGRVAAFVVAFVLILVLAILARIV